jgi:hypothetical protein
MAFHNKKETTQMLSEIINYQQFLKTDNDPVLKTFQTPEGIYLNIIRIEQTEQEQKTSQQMENFYNNYRDIIQEKKDE